MLGLRRLAAALLALGVRHLFVATLFVGAATFAALWLAPLDRPRALVHCDAKQSFESLMFSKDGTRFAAYFVKYGKGKIDSVAVELIDTETGKPVSKMMDLGLDDFQDMHTNHEENRFAARRKDGTTTVWSLATGEKIATAPVPNLDRALVVGDGGRLLLFERDPVRLRDAATNAVVAELPVDNKSRIVSFDFDRDQYVVRCTADGVHIYRKSSLHLVASLPAFRKNLAFTLTSRGMSSVDGHSCVLVEVRPDTVPSEPSAPLHWLMYHREVGRWSSADRWRSDDFHLSPDGKLAARVERVDSNWQRFNARILRMLRLQVQHEAVSTLNVFDTVCRKSVAKLHDVGSAWFSPDGTTLIAPGPDRTL